MFSELKIQLQAQTSSSMSSQNRLMNFNKRPSSLISRPLIVELLIHRYALV